MDSLLPAAAIVIGVVVGTRLRAWAIPPLACAVMATTACAPVAGLSTGPARIVLAVAALVLLELGFFIGACCRLRPGAAVPTS